jgi:class 3 adenylate cyclase/tetratricopeptide (TPR) repeat protein
LQAGKEEAGERRLAAVMFTDIVGYTSLTEKNESLTMNLLKEYRATLRSDFVRFNGREIETVGDAFLVEFPSSLEAVQCAYEIQSNLLELNRVRAESDRIRVRIGIHIGDIVHAGSTIFGDVVNVASRIQSVSEAGGITVSEEIYHQVKNKVSFSFESIGVQNLKNVERPIEIFKVVPFGSSDLDKQNQVYAARFMNRELPFIDRTLETETLRLLLDKTEATKQGSVVFISGEAGIGKSRLANEIKEYAVSRRFEWLSTICTRSEDSAPYSPWIQLLRDFASKAPTQLFYKICGPYIGQIVRLIPELAASSGVVPFHPALVRDPSQEADTEARERRQFYQAVTQFFVKLSKESGGLVLHFDDLQWADQATLQLLKFFVSNCLTSDPIVVIVSFRDLEAKSGENPAIVKFLEQMEYERKGPRITLKRFEETDVGNLLARLSGQRDVSTDFTDLIYSKTGGNPFFIGEVLKSLFERRDVFANERGQLDRKPITEIQVPSSISTLIRERVGRLGADSRETLMVASVIGDSFDEEILCSVMCEKLDHARCARALQESLRACFITKKENSMFAFADEWLRDVLLDQIEPQRKISIHRETALALEKTAKEFPLRKNELCSSIAYHFLSSGEKVKALEYSMIAADRSAGLFAHGDAAKHYATALELVSEDEPKAKLLRSLGDEVWFLGDSKKALAYWIEAADLYERIGDKAVASDLYRRIAFTYHTPFFEKENSILYINKAISLLEGSSEPGWELSAAFLNASLIYAWDSQVEKARQLFEKGRNLALDAHNRFIESIAGYTSVFVADFSERDQILRDCDNAINYLVEKSHIRQAGFAYSAKAGWYALIKGPSEETQRVFEEAMNYAEKAGVSTAVFALKSSLAVNVDLPLGKFDKVKKVAELMRINVVSFPSHVAMKCYHNLTMGLLQLHLGDFGESKQNLLEVTKIAKGFGNSSFAVQPYLALARAFVDERNYSEAEKFLLLANEICEKRACMLSNVMFQVELLALEIEFAVRSKRKTLREVNDVLSQLKKISMELGEPWARAYCLRSEGLLDRNQMNVERAVNLLSESASIWSKFGWTFELARTKYEIAIANQKLGDISLARKHNHEALEIFTSLGAKLDIERCVAFDNALKTIVDMPKFSNQTSRITFDYLITSFVDDYSMKSQSPQSSGWRTLREIAKHTGAPVSSLYFRAASTRAGSALSDLLASKTVESKTFKGERGRGGEVTRYRISYDKNEVKVYADQLIQARSEMLH